MKNQTENKDGSLPDGDAPSAPSDETEKRHPVGALPWTPVIITAARIERKKKTRETTRRGPDRSEQQERQNRRDKPSTRHADKWGWRQPRVKISHSQK